MTAPSLVIAGNLWPELGDKAARHWFGLKDAATLAEHVPADDNGANHSPRFTSVIVMGKPLADLLGLRSMGYGLTPHPGTQWRIGNGGPLYTFAVSVETKPGPPILSAMRRAIIPEMVLGCPTLRPWHFRTEDPAILHDLGVALCPLSPAVGMAFAKHAAEAHRMHNASTASAPSKAVASIAKTARRAMPAMACDEPLRDIATTLMRHNGGRELGERWGVNVKDFNAFTLTMPASADHGAARATVFRYMMEGMG
jgi:hypothetical protein